MSPRDQVSRLAMRVEGDLWVAYYALPNTMEGALFLGSIRMVFVQDESARQIFMALMRDAVSAVIKEQFGTAPTWPDPPRRAPEHERAGRA